MALYYMTRNLRIQSRTLSFLWKARAISCSSTNKDVQVKLRSDAQTIFRAALNAVSPQEMVKNNLSLHQNVLSVKDLEYTVDKNVSVVAFGKAVLGMTKAVQDILGHHIVGGVASISHGLPDAIKASGNKELIEKTILDESSPITVIEGAKNNLPDKTAQFAAIKIKKAAENVGENDILMVLISGGGSALLPFPVHPITLEEKLLTIKGLASSGATINELNTVRKNLSDLKGGKLAKAAFPAKVITLILSDVIGDPLDIIASGPTVPDPSSPTDCLEIFKRLNAESKIPTAVTQYLQQAEKSREHQNQAKLQGFPHVQNVIVGSNRYAVDAAKKRAEAIGYTPIVLSTTLSGEARDIGDMYYDVAHLAWTGHKVDFSPVSEDLITENIANSITSARASRKPICIIGAGETTVTLKGTGIGGRSQEMALALALKVNHNMERFSVKLDKTSESQGGLVLLSAGTDGQDGPCPAAGAIAEPSQVAEALSDGLNPAEFLDNNDSYTFYSKFQNGRDHVVTGLTGTNVMDIQVLLVSPPF